MSELPWDGTYLDFTLRECDTENGIKYGKLIEYNANCIYIKSSCKLPVIYELLKPLFDVRQTGCHYNKKYIVYKPYEKDDVWYKEIRLSDFDRYDKLKYSMLREIRNIICFRYFLFLTNISEKNILYRDIYVLSYDDRKGRANLKTYIISERLRKQWFPQVTIDKEICIMFRKYKDKINCELRSIITDIILKVDRKYIYLSSEFCNRLIDIFDYVKSQELHDKLDFLDSETCRDYTL